MVDIKKFSPPVPKIQKSRIRILSGVVLSRGVKARAGEVYEVPKHLATMLISNNQAELYVERDDEGGDAENAPAGVATVRMETATTHDPKPTKVDVPDLTTEHVAFLKSRGLDAPTLSKAKAFVRKLADAERASFFADFDAWKQSQGGAEQTQGGAE